jgi:L-cysteine/cystine lyase
MNAALWGWPLEEGDEVVTTTAEHPGLLVPLNGLVQRLGVALRVVDVGTGSGDLLDALLSACGERTRLIAVSHVLWTTGAVLPVAELAAAARERGIGLLLDGAQAAGQIPVDVDAIGADAYALPGQKWLCGPDGTGALLLGEDALSTIEPTYGGYFSQEATDSELGMVTLHPDARRYEVAIPTPAHAAGLEAAVAFLADDVGLAAAGRRGRSLAAELRERLAAAGGTVVSPEGDRATGLVTVVADDPAAAEVACRTAGVEIRSLPGLPWVRASVGAWNTVQDLDRFVAAVRPQLA